MSKYTPGPWVLENRGCKYIVSKPGDGYITRDVCRLDGSTMSAFAQEANARLIAAAPELLEALRGLLALDKEHHQRGHDDEDICQEVQAARAAIAKAEGENR